jgi:hypothetical protein
VLPEAPAPAEQPADAPPAEEEEREESIYEVMKGHMLRQKEEQEARNVAIRQQSGRFPGRPGPASPAKSETPRVEKVTDLTDLAGVWEAAQKFLSDNQARSVVLNLGATSRITRLNANAGEVVLEIPGHLRAYAGDKIKARIEDAIRTVTGKGLRLSLAYCLEAPKAPPPADGSQPGVSGIAANRVPAEVLEAIKQQKVVQELMKKLDASVTNVEMLGTGEE